jgi:GNAT superfamily N-acetyltransferase
MPEAMERGREQDVPAATACFAAAFRDDHFFSDHPEGWGAAATFFRLLMQARLALGMPVILARDGERVLGGAMGYDTRELEWPEALSAEWAALESASPHVAGRFAAYEEMSKPHGPTVPHYYLGVIGVQPELRGTGLGSRLLRAFCRLSDEDPVSQGTYLETAKPSNMRFYASHGFEVAGSGELEPGVDLWCMFRPRGARRERQR